MDEVLLSCSFDLQNLIRKSVTNLKLLNRAIYCRQAETCRSIRLDSTSKRVGVLNLRNCGKNGEEDNSKMARYSLPKHAVTDASGF